MAKMAGGGLGVEFRAYGLWGLGLGLLSLGPLGPLGCR